MSRCVFVLLFFVVVVPAFAKSRADKQPASCQALWPAVTATLGNAGNYKIIAIDSEGMKANFIIVGALFSQMDFVTLKPMKNGCDLQLHIGFTGSDDQAAFRKRVRHSLKLLNAASTPIPKSASAE